MGPLVAFEFLGCFKRLLTLQTFISFLSSVSQFVNLQVTGYGEDLSTVRAAERLPSSMEPLVLFEFLGCFKRLITLQTEISFLSGVSQFMNLQVTRHGEGLFTV